MCTVTFVPRPAGYYLAMNRDEQLTRVPGVLPKRYSEHGRDFICPTEPSGGTWISLNDQGVTLALINWYSIRERVDGHSVSRGEVVRCASTEASRSVVTDVLQAMPLQRINPFRLIGIFPATRTVMEWGWDLKRLRSSPHPWRLNQWISSGFNEPAAQIERTNTLQQMQRQKTAGSLAWLRRLHASHRPEPGPFSICMHRRDAATVSYTEIAVFRRLSRIAYLPGSRCHDPDLQLCRVSLRLRAD